MTNTTGRRFNAITKLRALARLIFGNDCGCLMVEAEGLEDGGESFDAELAVFSWEGG